jgi:hypothetical protein
MFEADYEKVEELLTTLDTVIDNVEKERSKIMSTRSPYLYEDYKAAMGTSDTDPVSTIAESEYMTDEQKRYDKRLEILHFWRSSVRSQLNEVKFYFGVRKDKNKEEDRNFNFGNKKE